MSDNSRTVTSTEQDVSSGDNRDDTEINSYFKYLLRKKFWMLYGLVVTWLVEGLSWSLCVAEVQFPQTWLNQLIIMKKNSRNAFICLIYHFSGYAKFYLKFRHKYFSAAWIALSLLASQYQLQSLNGAVAGFHTHTLSALFLSVRCLPGMWQCLDFKTLVKNK